MDSHLGVEKFGYLSKVVESHRLTSYLSKITIVQNLWTKMATLICRENVLSYVPIMNVVS